MTNQEVQQSPGAKVGFFYGYIVVAAALCIMVIMYGTFIAFGVFFKPMLTEFRWTRVLVSGAFSLSMVIQGLLAIVMGGLNDKFGPRIVLTFCGLLLGLGYLLMSQIDDFWQLYLFYGVMIGIGMSASWVPLLSTVARWFTTRRSMMTGIVLIGVGVGTLIGPLVSNWLISAYDWRTSYVILGSIVLVVVLIAAQFLKRDPIQMGQTPYGENEGEKQGLKVGTEGFSLKEAVYTRQFWLFFTMLFFFGFCVFTVIVHIVPHAVDLGISATRAANILAIIGVLTVVGNVVLGGAGDKIGNKQIFIIGFILKSVALFWLVPATEVWMFYLFAVVFGFARGGCATSESPLVAKLFGLNSHGLIFGVAGIGFPIGAAVGPLVTGYIFDVTGSYQLAFLISAAVGVVGLISTALLRPIMGRGTEIRAI